MHTFQSDQPAATVHQSLKSALTSMAEAKKCAVLWFGEVLERQLYRELGYSSINQYAQVELGFSKSRTGDFVALCRSFEKLPLLKEKIISGELGYTSGRMVVQVAGPDNETDRVKRALNTSRRQLEKEVKVAKAEQKVRARRQKSLLPRVAASAKALPAATPPVRVTMTMTPAQFARYEKLWERLRQLGELPADRVEALLAVMAAHEKAPRGDLSVSSSQSVQPQKPPVQIHVHRCPECAQATVSTSKGELALSASELARAECDCAEQHPGQRNRTAIPPATQRAVLARSRHRCERRGCDHTSYLEVHHIRPRARAGSNDPANLTCLCSACHRLLHEGRLVKEPETRYRWRQPVEDVVVM